MSYALANSLDRLISAGDGVTFEAAFQSEAPTNSVIIKDEQGFVVAKDAQLSNKEYILPSGRYKFIVDFWGDVGTEGKLTLETPTDTVGPKKVRITEGLVEERVAVGFEL